MRKPLLKSVPRWFTIDHQDNYYKSNEFLHRFRTVYEPSNHRNTPETNQQLKQWVSPRESSPKKAKVSLWATKDLAIVFCDTNGSVLIDYQQEERIIDVEYNTSWDRFNDNPNKTNHI